MPRLFASEPPLRPLAAFRDTGCRFRFLGYPSGSLAHSRLVPRPPRSSARLSPRNLPGMSALVLIGLQMASGASSRSPGPSKGAARRSNSLYTSTIQERMSGRSAGTADGRALIYSKRDSTSRARFSMPSTHSPSSTTAVMALVFFSMPASSLRSLA